MKLEYITIDRSYSHINKVKHLYERAFPVEERPSFVRLLSLNKNKIYGVEENGCFIGLVSTIEYEDLLYIFFLAVKKKFRHHGYGSKIIEDLLNKFHDRRIFLLAEDPSAPSSNKEERDNRIAFYTHNGLILTDTKIIEYGVEYVVLANKADVDKNDFLKVMEYLLDDYYVIYRSNVKC